MVVYNGYWNTVRKTIVGVLEDKNGKKFQMRFLVDSGATVSLILLNTLYMTRGEWDMGQTPKVILQGINSPSECTMMIQAKFSPGLHVSQAFKKEMSLSDNYSIQLKFLVQTGIDCFKTYKRSLPEEIGEEISKLGMTPADPEQLAPGEDLLYVHGIIGEDQIVELNETSIRPVGKEGMKITRSNFGDVLHGRSHFIKFPYHTNGLKLKGGQDFALDCIAQYGILSVPNSNPDNTLQERNYLQSICE